MSINKLFPYCLLLFTAFPVSAETISDPTMPPPGFRPDIGSMYPAPHKQAASGGLQGIIGSKDAAVAIINGQMVRVGDYYGVSKLIEAANGRAVLQSNQSKQVLYLHGKRQWLSHIHKPAPRTEQTGATNSAAALATVNVASLKVRTAANPSAEMIGGVKQGDRLEILGRQGDWLHIHTGRLKGFVHRDYVVLFDHNHPVTVSDEINRKVKP